MIGANSRKEYALPDNVEFINDGYAIKGTTQAEDLLNNNPPASYVPEAPKVSSSNGGYGVNSV